VTRPAKLPKIKQLSVAPLARARHPLDSRRNLDQRAVHLSQAPLGRSFAFHGDARLRGRRRKLLFEIRERGKNAARRIRLTGMVPATLYGGKKPFRFR
jgi:hypothetical protein